MGEVVDSERTCSGNVLIHSLSQMDSYFKNIGYNLR